MEKHNSSISMRDVAKACGVSVMTVSNVMRGRTTVAERTRARVMAKADELGYRPDPALSALAARRRMQGGAFRGAIAVLIMGDPPGGHMAVTAEALRHALLEIGYGCEFHGLPLNEKEGKRLSRELISRGIHGLILATFPYAPTALFMDWSRFAVVQFGRFLNESEGFHAITIHAKRLMRQTLDLLVERGYRRPALCTMRVLWKLEESAWEMAFAHYGSKRSEIVDTFDYSFDVDEGFDQLAAEIAGRIREGAIDALLSTGASSEFQVALEREGMEAGRDYGLFDLNLNVAPEKRRNSGAVWRRGDAAELTAGILHQKLLTGDYGKKEQPFETQYGFDFIEGGTLLDRTSTEGKFSRPVE